MFHFFSDADEPGRTVSRIMARLAPWSYLALSHLARDVEGKDISETFSRLNQQMAESVVLRTREEVTALFSGLEFIEPGVVQLPGWRPDPGTAPAGPLPMWCGVARKPLELARMFMSELAILRDMAILRDTAILRDMAERGT